MTVDEGDPQNQARSPLLSPSSTVDPERSAFFIRRADGHFDLVEG